MKFAISFAVMAVLLSYNLSAQTTSEPCGFDIWMRHVHQHSPERASRIADDYRFMLDNFQSGQRDGVLQIPVVFHIVHNNADQNLPDSVVYSQLEVLNEDYRRQNTNAAQTRDIFLPVAADAEIEFYLAQIDPDGNPTNGIVRTATDRSGFTLDLFAQENTLDEVKSSNTGGSDAWDTEHYLNVWVCNIEESLFGQIFGLAYPPNGAPNWPAGSAEPTAGVSGVIVHFTTVGRNNPVAALDGVPGNNLGRTLTHEVGHYLGLRHIWGDGFFNGCSADDGLADTPNCSAASGQSCNFNANTCTDSPTDFPDMVENYMDYSIESCQNMFTQEQIDMMRFAVTELRPGLLQSALSASSIQQLPQWNLFPNPTAGYFVVQGVNALKIDRIEVCDITGKVLLNTQPSAQVNHEISVESFSSGVYLVKVFAAGSMSAKKLLIY
jgi:hypothetical protein